jgi:methyl coenzyme M reductase beta subunit
MHWAIDVLAPTSDSDVWEKYVATGILVALANDGATDAIRKLSATVLANNARVVS